MTAQPADPAGSAALARVIAEAIRRVLRDSGREPGAVEPAMLIGADLGLDSLDIAQTIVLLERDLGVDPFRHPPAGAGRPAIRTVGDLVDVYGRAGAAPRAAGAG